MSHLSPSEMIDLLEGTLADARRAHARECVRCRDEAAQVALAWDAARDADVPEPSPLYWDHFAQRVHDTVRKERPRATWRSILEWRGALAAAAAAMLIVIGTALSWRVDTDLAAPGNPTPPMATKLENSSNATPQTVSLETDPGWDVVTGVADGMEWDAARDAGFAVKPGAAERAVLQLSDEQRQELARMLQAEIARLKS